jgi:GPI-anchor transamidase subunit K
MILMLSSPKLEIIVLLAAFIIASSTENWAILLCTSRYFFNYRHFVNALSVYKTIKDAGYTDDRIIFMNSDDDITCDARNPIPGQVNSDIGVNFFRNLSDHIELDYKGTEVTVDAFLRLLVGRAHSFSQLSQRLRSNGDSHVLLYMTGHGGDEFFKFQDQEELSAQEFAYAIEDMYKSDRFLELLVVLDTCQAATMCVYIDTPNVICVGSSSRGENSYAYMPDQELGLPLTDRFTYAFSEYISRHFSVGRSSDVSLKSLLDSLDTRFLQVSYGRTFSHVQTIILIWF